MSTWDTIIGIFTRARTSAVAVEFIFSVVVEFIFSDIWLKMNSILVICTFLNKCDKIFMVESIDTEQKMGKME